MPYATQEDVRRILLALRELRDRVDGLERDVRAIAAQVGWERPPEPAEPELPSAVAAMVERGDRRGAVFALARERGVSNHLAEQELKRHGLWRG